MQSSLEDTGKANQDEEDGTQTLISTPSSPNTTNTATTIISSEILVHASTSSSSSSSSDFDFSARFSDVGHGNTTTTTSAAICGSINTSYMSSAEELFHNGKIRPLNRAFGCLDPSLQENRVNSGSHSNATKTGASCRSSRKVHNDDEDDDDGNHKYCCGSRQENCGYSHQESSINTDNKDRHETALEIWKRSRARRRGLQRHVVRCSSPIPNHHHHHHQNEMRTVYISNHQHRDDDVKGITMQPMAFHGDSVKTMDMHAAMTCHGDDVRSMDMHAAMTCHGDDVRSMGMHAIPHHSDPSNMKMLGNPHGRDGNRIKMHANPHHIDVNTIRMHANPHHIDVSTINMHANPHHIGVNTINMHANPHHIDVNTINMNHLDDIKSIKMHPYPHNGDARKSMMLPYPDHGDVRNMKVLNYPDHGDRENIKMQPYLHHGHVTSTSMQPNHHCSIVKDIHMQHNHHHNDVMSIHMEPHPCHGDVHGIQFQPKLYHGDAQSMINMQPNAHFGDVKNINMKNINMKMNSHPCHHNCIHTRPNCHDDELKSLHMKPNPDHDDLKSIHMQPNPHHGDMNNIHSLESSNAYHHHHRSGEMSECTMPHQVKNRGTEFHNGMTSNRKVNREQQNHGQNSYSNYANSMTRHRGESHRRARSLSPLRVFHIDDLMMVPPRPSFESHMIYSSTYNNNNNSSISEKAVYPKRRTLEELLKEHETSRNDGKCVQEESGMYGNQQYIMCEVCNNKRPFMKDMDMQGKTGIHEPQRASLSSSQSNPHIFSGAHHQYASSQRAQAEVMKKRTLLPYRHGLMGCLGFFTSMKALHVPSLHSISKRQ